MAETPAEYGRLAFEAGKPCASALDQEFVRQFCNGKVGTALPALRAWQRGWIEASLAAPIPETEEE